MGIDFGNMLNSVVKGASDFIDKTGRDITRAIDQNGDGRIDLSDIHTVSDRIQTHQANSRRKAALERLKPLFPDDFERAEFVMPKMILVAEIDKAHADNPVCKGSIGFKTILNDMSAMLKAMKVSGNTTIVSEVQNEARRMLEYEIDF